MRKTVVCICVALFTASQALGQSPTIAGPTGIGVNSQTTGMSERGHVVGTGQFPTPGCEAIGAYRAFSWTAKGGVIDLGTLGGCRAHARAVNNLGHVAGDSLMAGDVAGNIEWRVFFWTPESGMIDTGVSGGGVYGYGVYIADINDRGQVVGAVMHPVDRQWHVFSWTLKGGMIDLGLGWPIAVNERGQISGYMHGEYGQVAVLWETAVR